MEDEGADISVGFGCEEMGDVVAFVDAFGGLDELVGGELCGWDDL